MSRYVVPNLRTVSFTCPTCGSLAQQKKSSLDYYLNLATHKFDMRDANYSDHKGEKLLIDITTCQSCFNYHIWINSKMVTPEVSNIPMPLEDMPEKVKDIYNEARGVFSKSYKAATALLRLALEYLCDDLSAKGKDVNEKIGYLVSRGLPIEIQQALDTVRIAGNNAVHPGVIDLEDNDTSAILLFEMLNLIVDNRIIQPLKIRKFYSALPEGSRKGIEKRDNK